MADQELARDLGFLEAYTIGVGTMIGAGIFVLPSIAAQNAGPASMVSFAIGGFVSLLAALSLSELATGMPRAGGSYYYVNRALGSFFGSVVGVGMWSGLMFASAFYMLGFGQYLTFFYGNMPVGLAALVMAVLLVMVNYRGVKETGALQNLIVVALLGLILVFAAFGLFNISWETFRPFNPYGWGAVAATAATVYVSFIGFEVIATSAEEIKDPGRNLPLAMIASVLTPTLLYVVVMMISTGVLPVPELVASQIPVADVAAQYLGGFGALMMVLGAVLATVSSANASILSAARVNFAMGRDKILSDWLNQVHTRYRTPYRAILVTGAVILGLIALGVGLETLADVASFTYLLTYSLVHVAVIVMRRADPEDYQPDFELPGLLYPAVPALGCLSCVVILAQMRVEVLLLGGGIVVLGMSWYWIYAAARALRPSLVGEAIASPSERRESLNARYRVVVPVANPNTERHLLELASASAEGKERAELVAVNVIEVPVQTALEQDLAFEEERVEKQRELLTNAREFAREQNIGLRTRAIVGRNVWEVVLNVIAEEQADHVLLGWTGERKRTRHLLGSNIDKIAREASCQVTLLKQGRGKVRNVVALAGEGPQSPLAARRAVEFANVANGGRVTLLNVQRSTGGEERSELEGRARTIIRNVAAEAGLSDDEYEPKVVFGDDIRTTILEAIREFDTVCVGATRSTNIAQAIFGSIPEMIGEEFDGTVAIVRGSIYRPRTVKDAIVERLSRSS
jgi:amino acid transporter